MTPSQCRATLAIILALTVLAWPASAQTAAATPRAEQSTYSLGEKWTRDDEVDELVRIVDDRYVFLGDLDRETHLAKGLTIPRLQ
jgi:hypothetical protein